MFVVFIGLISGGLCLFSVTNYSGAIEIVLNRRVSTGGKEKWRVERGVSFSELGKS
jgi:hypothetical protein